jgi:hypothetical protein
VTEEEWWWEEEEKKPVRRVIGIGLLILVLGVLAGMLWFGYVSLPSPTPVAAAFTRVGGATQVETAVYASRFWLKRPWGVVMTRADASQGIMLGAGVCAMSQNTPLLFSTRYRKRQQLVHATLDGWRDETAKGHARLQVTKIRNQDDVADCLANWHQRPVPRLTTLPHPLFRDRWRLPCLPVRAYPCVPGQDKLAPVVVFAAAKAPGSAPDVAVGLALAAHMTHMTKAKRDFSLVVVPRYLDAYPQLEAQLRNQPDVVQGGVMLGSGKILSEDTHALLRRLLTAPDQQGFFAQLENNLGLLGSVLVGLLAIVGLGTAAAALTIAGIRYTVNNYFRPAESSTRSKGPGEPPNGSGRPPNGAGRPPNGRGPFWIRNWIERLGRRLRIWGRKERPMPGSDWLTALGSDGKKKVTIWLRSGWAVTGTISGPNPPRTVFRLDDADFDKPEGRFKPPQAAKPTSVLVAVDQIELITVVS